MSTVSSDLIKLTKTDCAFFLFIIFYVSIRFFQNKVDLVVVSSRNEWLRDVIVIIGWLRIRRSPKLFDPLSTANAETNCEGKDSSKYTSKYND